MEKIIIAYCRDNMDLARHMDEQLSRIGLNFDHITNLPGATPSQFTDALQASTSPVLVIITDNFLRNLNCMANATAVFKAMMRNNRLMPIVADGIRINEEENTVEKVVTKFDRVIHAIQYLNYWQNIYLETNAQLEHLSGQQKAACLEKLEQIKSVNEQISDLFNSIRDNEYVLWDDLKRNDFELFFQKFGINEWHPQFKQINQIKSTNQQKSETATATLEQQIAEPAIHIASLPEKEVITEPIAEVNIEQQAVTAQRETMLNIIRELEEEEQDLEAHITEDEDLDLDQWESNPGIAPVASEIEPEVSASMPIVGDKPAKEDSKAKPSQTRQKEKKDDYLVKVMEARAKIEALTAFGEYHEAIELSKQLHASHPQDDALRFQYTQLLATHSNAPIEVEQELNILVKNGYPESQISVLRGDLALQQNDPVLAKEWWNSAVLADPEDAKTHLKLGDLLESHFRGAKKTAAMHYRMAAEILENDPRPSMKYANLMLDYLDKPKKAAKYFRKAAAIQEDLPEAWYGLALAEHHLGNDEAGAEAYQKAFTLTPNLRSEVLDKIFQPYLTKTTEPEVPEVLTVIVTGATSGIGLATARIFLENGHRVIMTGRRNERLIDQKEQLSTEYPESEVLTAPFDVRNLTEVNHFIDHLPEEWRNIDVLINNAGLAKGLSFIHEGDITEWDTMIDTNIKGLLYMTRAIAPHMVARKKGHIINISSSAGKEVYPKGNVYCATKWAVEALTKGMRLDLHQHGIRVSQVSPGHVENTEFAITRFSGDAEKANIYQDFQPLHATDIAETIYFMVTRPSHVNIQDIQIFASQQANSTVIDRSGRSDK
jgi:NADP-dependent 3-hydroxy acid dehydrogenase YdfG/Flp pilus assembly protein TadD